MLNESIAVVDMMSIPCANPDDQLDAVVFVHGISPHRPMEALERLIREYEKHLRPEASSSDFTWQQFYHKVPNTEEPTPYLRVIPGQPYGEDRDFFEALWSPIAKHRVAVWRIIAWVIISSLTPARFRAPNSPTFKRAADSVAVLGVGLLVTFLSLVAALTLILAFASVRLAALAPASLMFVAAGVATLLALRYIAVNLDALPWRVFKSRTVGIVGLCVWAFALVLLMVALDQARLDASTPSWWFAGSLTICTCCLVLLSYCGQVLNDYIGDVYIATRTDINDRAYNVRATITKQVAELLHSLLTARWPSSQEPKYRKIVVLGHSLGSVISLDAIRLLRERYEAEIPAEQDRNNPDNRSEDELMPLNRLTALVTYGSPLQKIGTLRGAASQPATLSEQFLRKITKDVFGAGRTRWINLWQLEDPVSDPLATAPWLADNDVIVDLELKRGTYFLCHGHYHSSPEFWKNDAGSGVLDLLS